MVAVQVAQHHGVEAVRIEPEAAHADERGGAEVEREVMLPLSIQKHALPRPPDPNASPHPTTVRRIAPSSKRTRRGAKPRG